MRADSCPPSAGESLLLPRNGFSLRAGVPFVAVVSRPQNLGSGEPSHDGDASPQRRGCSWTDLANGACGIGVKAAQQQAACATILAAAHAAIGGE